MEGRKNIILSASRSQYRTYKNFENLSTDNVLMAKINFALNGEIINDNKFLFYAILLT